MTFETLFDLLKSLLGNANAVCIRFVGVLSTSNRKPPLRIPLRRVAEILTHPGQVEVVSPKRVDVLAKERSDVAQRFVSNLVALGTSLGNDSVHLHHVPGHHGIV